MNNAIRAYEWLVAEAEGAPIALAGDSAGGNLVLGLALRSARADLAGLPPLLLHVGSTETLLDDSQRIHDRVREAGGASELRIFEGVAHGWQMLVPLVPEATVSLREAAAFIARHVSAA